MQIERQKIDKNGKQCARWWAVQKKKGVTQPRLDSLMFIKKK